MKTPESRPNRLAFWATLFWSIAICAPVGAAEVTLGHLVQEYDGTSRTPSVTTDPSGLEVSLEFFPRSQAEEIYRRAPIVPQPSHPSYGLNGTNDKSLGDVINLSGTNRRLESVEAVLVNWARAESYPTLAAANPDGYLHPLTFSIYRVIGQDLFLLAEETREFLIPWRPATLDDGGEYPFGGATFRARFDFLEEITVSGQLALLISYNTANGGRSPLGVPGPYDSLNVALSNRPVDVGSDDDPGRVVRELSGLGQSAAFGSLAPMFIVRAFPEDPVAGDPIDAGGYLVEANVTSGGESGQAIANFEIQPQPVELTLTGLKQVADGSPKSVGISSDPSGVPFEVVFANRDEPPTERGLYPVFVRLADGNYEGAVSGVMRLGYSFQTWIDESGVAAGLRGPEDDPDDDGWSNFDEYRAATHPDDGGDFPMPLFQLIKSGEGALAEFVRNNEAADLEYFLEASEDLGESSSWQQIALPREPTNPFVPSEILSIPLEFVPGERRFFRLRCSTVAGGN
ncbi:MAG: MBG domain-containing protein [Akkermansiaceae bacterium]